jgi:hypothetical protein
MHNGAGTSARAGYRAARAQRRRGAVRAGLLLVLAAASGWGAFRGAGGGSDVLAAVAAGCLVAAWLMRPRPDAERWLRGAAGEAATALLLQRLPARRWVVRHDLRIPGSRANLDHLVIGRTGVWAVDTKTTRAQIRAGWRSVRFGDRRLDPGPAQWEAQVVADRLGTPARPLIVVHGIGLRRRGGRSGGVPVVPADGLVRRIRRGRRRLGPDEIAHLTRQADAVFLPASSEKDASRRG